MANEENEIHKSKSGLTTFCGISGNFIVPMSLSWLDATCNACWDAFRTQAVSQVPSLADVRMARLEGMLSEVRTSRERAATEVAAWSKVLGEALDLEARLTARIRSLRGQDAPGVPEAGSGTPEPQNRPQTVIPLLTKYEGAYEGVTTSKPMPY